MIEEKKKNRKKNQRPTLKDVHIYEDFVTNLLESSSDYFALKAGYWDTTRTVYSLKQETIKELKKEQRELFKVILEKGFKHNQVGSTATKQLVVKLDELSSKINDLKNGKSLYFKVIDFAEWKEVMRTLNFNIQDRLINGEKYKITGVGYLQIFKIERSKRSYLNWKYRHQEEDDYVLITLKKVCRIRNRQVYFARPTMGDPGVSFKYRLFEALRTRPEVRARYPLITSKIITEINVARAAKAKAYYESLKNKEDVSL